MSGGRLLTAGTTPHLLDGIANAELRQFFDEYAKHVTEGVDLFDYRNVIDVLVRWDCRTVVAVTATGKVPSGLLATRRIWEDAEILHLVHSQSKRQTMEIRFTSGVTGHVEEWDYRNGSMTPVSGCSPDEAFRIDGSWEPYEARTYVFLPEPLEENQPITSRLEVERVVELEWTGTRMGGNNVALRECRFPGHAWGDLTSMRALLKERLEGLPEGVFGSLEWEVFVPMEELECARWTATLFCPEDGCVSCNGIVLEAEKESVMPYPGLRTYLLPEAIAQSDRIVVEGKWCSPDQIDIPILTGEFSLTDGVFSKAADTIPIGAWSEAGLGSYGGRVTYRTKLQGDERSDSAPIILELDGLDSPAEVRVNGQVADHVVWKPYRCDIRRFWAAGPLNIEVEVAGSWYNLLHPTETPIAQGLRLAPQIRIYACEREDSVL
jgi:hypothetical protein